MGLPLQMIEKLQLVQNVAAWVFAESHWFDSGGPLLWQLHRLLVHFQAEFKELV